MEKHGVPKKIFGRFFFRFLLFFEFFSPFLFIYFFYFLLFYYYFEFIYFIIYTSGTFVYSTIFTVHVYTCSILLFRADGSNLEMNFISPNLASRVIFLNHKAMAIGNYRQFDTFNDSEFSNFSRNKKNIS